MSETTVVGHEVLLAQLTARLEELAAAPVAGHPDVLEDVHRTLVDALDGLGITNGSIANAGVANGGITNGSAGIGAANGERGTR